MKRTISILVAVFLVAASAASAQGGPRAGGTGTGTGMLGGSAWGGAGLNGRGARFERNLFPPELVLRNQIEIGLTDEQTAQIKKLLTESHGRMIDAQVDLQRAVERLNTTLENPRIDEGAAIAAAEQTMAIEMKVKKEHLGLLVRVKNILTEEQQRELAAKRGPRAGGTDNRRP